ncbi:MAG TPA: pyridoxamine 5'-phosphate oxidase family protein, partial [Ilumatobacter sp.]|nr:pyridoxamine 5'-phosphate oxidase family protein [Ilumatobacter sp.]
MIEPVATELDTRFSGSDAKATPWDQARRALTEARIYWITTVRHDLRPHVTPLIGLFIDDTFYFCTGPDEQKAKNIVDNSNCAVVTGSNTYGEGLDIVVEGNADRLVEEARLQELARQFVEKYGPEWQFEVRDSAFHHTGGEAWV